MAIVSRGEASAGPVAVDGRTITLVARSDGMRLGPLVWQRPQYVEVLDAEGRHTVIPLRDLDHMTIAVLLDGAASRVAWKRNGYGRVGIAVAVAAVTVWRITRRATR